MKNVITIGRALGSGGRTIGKKVADALGIAYYDRELIDEVAKKNGFASEFVEKADENTRTNALYNLAMGGNFFMDVPHVISPGYLPLSTQVYLAQKDAITEYAKEPCVIVGRCADYILRDRDDVLSVFLFANYEERVRRAVKHYGVDQKKAVELIAKSDKARTRHYSAFTDWEWGNRDHYDLMINTTTTGFQGATDIICQAFNADPTKK